MSAAERRKESPPREFLSAAGVRGPTDLLDFILPLWAGAELGLDSVSVGFMLALELAVGFVTRPWAGHLADTRNRRILAAVGAGFYALSFLLYAAADASSTAAWAFSAAALAGMGASLFWVAVRASVSEYLSLDTAIFARLRTFEENGSWIAFFTGLTALGTIHYAGLFVVCAAACALSGGILLSSTPTSFAIVPISAAEPDSPVQEAARSSLRVVSRFWPLLLSVFVSILAESALTLVLLFHLQRHFNLGPVQAAYVFLPGALAGAFLPVPLHRVTELIGRRRGIIVAGSASTSFALTLGFVDIPWIIAGLWILCGVSWAFLIPLEQAVVAGLDRAHVGRSLGAYESLALAGGGFGALLAGFIYSSANWLQVCMLTACFTAFGSLLTAWAFTRLSIADRPSPPDELPIS